MTATFMAAMAGFTDVLDDVFSHGALERFGEEEDADLVEQEKAACYTVANGRSDEWSETRVSGS